MSPALVDFLGVLSTFTGSPAIGDMLFRDESGGFNVISPPASPTGREVLHINTANGHPVWVDAIQVLGGLGLHAGRFIGGQTATGAPTSGTWLTNDWMVDGAGTVHTCTAGGTPGTWT